MIATLVALGVLLLASPALAQRPVDTQALFEEAVREGRVGEARRTRPVDARPAQPGEVIGTVIQQGDGLATRARPAAAGDWVARNRCLATGREQYLIAAARFPQRCGTPRSEPGAEGWGCSTPSSSPRPTAS
jgi:hypothetical protein